MKSNPKNRNNNNKNISKIKSSNANFNSQTFNISFQFKDTFATKLNKIKNARLKQNLQNKKPNIKSKNELNTINHKKLNMDKKVQERYSSAKPVRALKKNNFNQNIDDKIVVFKIMENNKIRNNSAFSDKNAISKEKNKSISIIKHLYINKKDLSELEKNIKNNLYLSLNIIYIYGQIEYEIINIIQKKEKKELYKKLFEYFNTFFDKYLFTGDINFLIKNELNILFNKSLQLLLCYHCILFTNIILFSVNDSISIINTQYETQFKKISKIIYNIFYKYIYIILKNTNTFQKNFTDFYNFIENQLNQLIEKNKYKLILNSKNKNNDEVISFLNKTIDKYFCELKEMAETMRLSQIAPVAYSIKLLINSFNKKNLISFIDIMNNVILYSLLNKNIEIAYKNMLKDKNSDFEVSYSRNSVPYLPEISKDKIYTLVLDLDETLIHFFSLKVEIKGDPHYGYFSSDDEYGVFNNYLIDDKNEKEKVDENNYDTIKIGMFLLRPYAKQFLKELNKYYEITIFTTGTKEYCDRVLQLLDLDNNLIKYRLYKHHIALKDINVSVKDLTLLGRDLSKTIIVDNLEGNFRRQPDHGLPIITWKGDINDFSLKYLTNILKSIVINKVPDVRKIIKKIKTQIKSENNPSYSKVNINNLFS